MSMFFEMLNAINNPNQTGSVEQLGKIVGGIQQLQGQHGLDTTTTEKLMSAMTPMVRSAMQQQPSGGNFLMDMVGQLAGAGGGSSAIRGLFSQQMQQQMVQGISQQTGLKSTMIQTVLPALLPLVCQMFTMGTAKPGMNGKTKYENEILNGFLAGDGDDLGNVLKFAGRFLNPAT
jgi:hypothetical protein